MPELAVPAGGADPEGRESGHAGSTVIMTVPLPVVSGTTASGSSSAAASVSSRSSEVSAGGRRAGPPGRTRATTPGRSAGRRRSRCSGPAPAASNGDGDGQGEVLDQGGSSVITRIIRTRGTPATASSVSRATASATAARSARGCRRVFASVNRLIGTSTTQSITARRRSPGRRASRSTRGSPPRSRRGSRRRTPRRRPAGTCRRGPTRTRDRAPGAVPSSRRRRGRARPPPGRFSALPFTRSAMAAISSATATTVTSMGLPVASGVPRRSSTTGTPAAPIATSVWPCRHGRPSVSVTTTPTRRRSAPRGRRACAGAEASGSSGSSSTVPSATLLASTPAAAPHDAEPVLDDAGDAAAGWRRVATTRTVSAVIACSRSSAARAGPRPSRRSSRDGEEVAVLERADRVRDDRGEVVPGCQPRGCRRARTR